MALSKEFTLSTLRSLIRDLADEIEVSNLQDETIRQIINKNTLDIAEQLNGASAPDYGTKTTVSDAAASYSATVRQGAGYTSSTKTIASTSHGLTSADVGKRIVFWDDGDPITKVGIAEIVSIVDDDSFTVSVATGADITSPACDYAVFSAHSGTSIDLSSLKIDKIIKLVDSTNGPVAAAKDDAFDNLANNDMYDNSVMYNYFGETLYLFKGADVSAWGTLSLYYYRLPTLLSADGDYVDLRDKYVPLLIDKCYLEVYTRGKKGAPQTVVDNVKNATAFIRGANTEKEAKIMERKG